MRQILILRGSKCGNIIVLNLSDTHTYAVKFRAYGRSISDKNEEETIGGILELEYANKKIHIDMLFLDREDADEFESVLVEYMMNGSLPLEVEGGKSEIRYWMEFEVLEVRDAYA